PYLENWMREQLGATAAYREWRRHLPENVRALLHLPRLAAQALEAFSEHRASMEWHSTQFDRWHDEVARGSRRRAVAIVGAGLTIAASILLVGDLIVAGVVVSAAAVAAFAFAVFR